MQLGRRVCCHSVSRSFVRSCDSFVQFVRSTRETSSRAERERTTIPRAREERMGNDERFRRTLGGERRVDASTTRPNWISDVNADERRREYALTPEEYEAKRASRVSKHLEEIRLEKYAQFEDELNLSETMYGGYKEEGGGEGEEDVEDAAARGEPLDLDMALFWARRRADAARASAHREQTASTGARHRLSVKSQAREVDELKRVVREERQQREACERALEKKQKEIERLRSQLAKYKLQSDEASNRDFNSGGNYILVRAEGKSRAMKIYEDELPLYSQLRGRRATWLTDL